MKEIGTFKIDKNMCSNCREDENCPQKYSVNGNCIYSEKDLVKEQVPEDFEELKELCKDLEGKNVFIINAGNCIEFNGLYFWIDGSITTTENNEDIWATKTNLTPARQWNIIKNLVGEE